MNVPAKFEVRSFTRSWDNSGYLKILGSPWIRPRSLLWAFVRIYPLNARPNLKFVALPVPEIIAGTLKLCAVTGYAVQGHPRSLILVPIESAYATSY